MKKALVVLAEGFEEIEAITCIDTLRRGSVNVTVAALAPSPIKGSHGIAVHADVRLTDIRDEFDALVLPGGMPGASNLAASAAINALIDHMAQNSRIIAAICAAPAIVLSPAGVLSGKMATCFPGMENLFAASTKFLADPVVVDGSVITSRGPGTALRFALTVLEKLAGEETARSVGRAMLA